MVSVGSWVEGARVVVVVVVVVGQTGSVPHDSFANLMYSITGFSALFWSNDREKGKTKVVPVGISPLGMLWKT